MHSNLTFIPNISMLVISRAFYAILIIPISLASTSAKSFSQELPQSYFVGSWKMTFSWTMGWDKSALRISIQVRILGSPCQQ